MSENPGLIKRIVSALRPPTSTSSVALSGPVRESEPISLLTREEKASSMSRLPKGAYGPVYEFFSADGGRTFIEGPALTGTVLAFTAYWYCATRWRAQKIAEAPLMVVEEDQEEGDEEWLPEHELVSVLDEPSLDYDMGELLERTSHYLDNTSECIWTMDRDRGQRIARLTPFKRGEFTVERSDERLYATFRVNTIKGPQTFDADDVCYFRDSHEGWMNDAGKSRLDVAMSWLRLGEVARQTVRDLLANSVWPSGVVSPHHEWNPDKPELDLFKQELEQYSKSGNRGKPFVALGGGKFDKLAASIHDLVPTELLNRVESVVAAVSGVPAIVLQFEVGLQNSPWSQMQEARKMAYEDCINPAWKKLERVMTRQMLRKVDDDPTHFIRFDRSQVHALQENQMEAAQIATTWGRAASLNERRQRMGLEPLDDPKADEVPELVEPSAAELMAAANQNAAANGNDKKPEDQKPDDEPPVDKKPPKDKTDKAAMFKWCVQHKSESWNMTRMLRDETTASWEVMYHGLLQKDRDEIVAIVNDLLTEAHHKSIAGKARGKDSVMRAVSDYLSKEGHRTWVKTMQPAMVRAAERSVSVASADSGVRYSVLQKHAIQFAQRNAASSITEVSKTTKRLVNDIIVGGLQENRTTTEIAQLIHEATGFSKSRAKTIARTESTTIFGGAPVEALSAFSKASDRTFFKTWFGVMDAKERDEHVAMEGETVEISAPFSNGLMFPQEPNCRCHIITHEGVDE